MKLHCALYFPKIKSTCLTSLVTLKWNGSTVQASLHLSKNGSVHTVKRLSKQAIILPPPSVRLPWQSGRESMRSFATMGKK